MSKCQCGKDHNPYYTFPRETVSAPHPKRPEPADDCLAQNVAQLKQKNQQPKEESLDNHLIVCSICASVITNLDKEKHNQFFHSNIKELKPRRQSEFAGWAYEGLWPNKR